MGSFTVASVLSDAQWTFALPVLPCPYKPSARPGVRARAMLHHRLTFAAVVYAVSTGRGWNYLPVAFSGVHTSAYRRFRAWTDADVWRRLGAAAIATPHEQWATALAHAAIDRAGHRARGWPDHLYDFTATGTQA